MFDVEMIGGWSVNLDAVVSDTLTALAYDIRDDLKAETESELNITSRPILTGYSVVRATRATLEAVVYLKKGWRDDILPHHFTGGVGGVIGTERSLIRGGEMGRDSSAIYLGGRLTKARARRVLTDARAGRGMFIKRSRGGRLKPGIYAKYDDGRERLKLVTPFVDVARYRKRIDLVRLGQQRLQRSAQSVFQRKLNARRGR